MAANSSAIITNLPITKANSAEKEYETNKT